jgi:hypothetical protein
MTRHHTADEPQERLRCAVRAQQGPWTVKEAIDILGPVWAFKKEDGTRSSGPTNASRARALLAVLVDEGLLRQDGKQWHRTDPWTPGDIALDTVGRVRIRTSHPHLVWDYPSTGDLSAPPGGALCEADVEHPLTLLVRDGKLAAPASGKAARKPSLPADTGERAISPSDRLRAAVLTQQGPWDVKQAITALGVFPTLNEHGGRGALARPSRARQSMKLLVEEGLLRYEAETKTWHRTSPWNHGDLVLDAAGHLRVRTAHPVLVWDYPGAGDLSVLRPGTLTEVEVEYPLTLLVRDGKPVT